jgi:hypothetical protein
MVAILAAENPDIRHHLAIIAQGDETGLASDMGYLVRMKFTIIHFPRPENIFEISYEVGGGCQAGMRGGQAKKRG